MTLHSSINLGMLASKCTVIPAYLLTNMMTIHVGFRRVNDSWMINYDIGVKVIYSFQLHIHLLTLILQGVSMDGYQIKN